MIIDTSRRIIDPGVWGDASSILSSAAAQYRRDIWQDKGETVQIWIEKDALSEIVADVTRRLHVPLYVCKGYPSHTFVHAAVQEIEADGRPCHVFHFGDLDPSGANASETIENLINEFKTGGTKIYFERIALTEEQVIEYQLPTRPTKTSDTRAAKWGDRPSVELDALTPQQLRDLVEGAIARHLDQCDIDTHGAIEQQEKHYLAQVVEGWKAAVAQGGTIKLLPPAGETS